MVVEVTTNKNDADDSKHEEEEQTDQEAEKRDSTKSGTMTTDSILKRDPNT